MYTIYKITNLVNQKCYIGQTKHSIQNRFAGHKNKKNGPMYSVIKQYGKENFSIKPIDYAETYSEAVEKESFWTVFFKSNNSQYGYNKNIGNNLCQEVKESISNTLKGRYAGEKNPYYGKHHSPEVLEKISGENHWTTRKEYPKEALKKKHDALYRKPTFRSRPVRCVETGEVQPMAKEFYYKYGYLDCKILDCCKGRRKTHHGFHWEYADN